MNLINYFITGLIVTIKFPIYAIKYILIGLYTVLTIIPRYLIIGIKYITEKKDSTNPNKNILQDRFIPTTIITLSLITYLLSVFILTRWYVQSERTKKFMETLNEDILAIPNEEITENTPNQYEDLTSEVPQATIEQKPTEIQRNTTSYTEIPVNTNYINVNLDYYISKNPETVAWLQVNNTNINYPIVQHSDNSYYLTHDFYQRNTNVGWVYGDFRDNFEDFNNNTIIYGHNLINRTMFGQLPYLTYGYWFNSANAHYIKLSTKNTNSLWQIFSVYKIEPTVDYLTANFDSTSKYQEFLDKIKSRSIRNFNMNVTYTDKIITLSTCDDTGTKRVAVHAKLIGIENK